MKRSKHVVITASLVPEADNEDNSKIEEEIRKEVKNLTIPWVKGVLKVTISDYLFQDLKGVRVGKLLG